MEFRSTSRPARSNIGKVHAVATAYMKWLETRPGAYDRGISLLTLGRLQRLHAEIATRYGGRHVRVLELGCGTGSLAARMAESGSHVTAIDASPQMLEQAGKKVSARNLGDRVSLVHLDADLKIAKPRGLCA